MNFQSLIDHFLKRLAPMNDFSPKAEIIKVGTALKMHLLNADKISLSNPTTRHLTHEFVEMAFTHQLISMFESESAFWESVKLLCELHIAQDEEEASKSKTSEEQLNLSVYDFFKLMKEKLRSFPTARKDDSAISA